MRTDAARAGSRIVVGRSRLGAEVADLVVGIDLLRLDADLGAGESVQTVVAEVLLYGGAGVIDPAAVVEIAQAVVVVDVVLHARRAAGPGANALQSRGAGVVAMSAREPVAQGFLSHTAERVLLEHLTVGCGAAADRLEEAVTVVAVTEAHARAAGAADGIALVGDAARSTADSIVERGAEVVLIEGDSRSCGSAQVVVAVHAPVVLRSAGDESVGLGELPDSLRRRIVDPIAVEIGLEPLGHPSQGVVGEGGDLGLGVDLLVGLPQWVHEILPRAEVGIGEIRLAPESVVSDRDSVQLRIDRLQQVGKGVVNIGRDHVVGVGDGLTFAKAVLHLGAGLPFLVDGPDREPLIGERARAVRVGHLSGPAQIVIGVDRGPNRRFARVARPGAAREPAEAVVFLLCADLGAVEAPGLRQNFAAQAVDVALGRNGRK